MAKAISSSTGDLPTTTITTTTTNNASSYPDKSSSASASPPATTTTDAVRATANNITPTPALARRGFVGRVIETLVDDRT